MSELETTKQTDRKSRYYVKFTKAGVEEDQYHEFKGHRNLSNEDLPFWTRETRFEKGSRKSISRNLCGFLNSGHGTVYCGIIDNGDVHGLKLSQYSRDHIVGAMNDLMSRYKPPVDRRRWRVTFVPVVSASSNEDETEEISKFNIKETVKETERDKPHRFRTPHYCWCDKDMEAQYNQGVLFSDYVIEVKILPWDPQKDYKGGLGKFIKLQPIHADEEGKVYFRRQASLVQYSIQEIANLTRYEAQNRCRSIEDGLQQELSLVNSAIRDKQLEAKEEEEGSIENLADVSLDSISE